jgi:hypothetical protein
MPGLLRDGGELARDGQDVVGAARNSWLLRDNFEAKSMRTAGGQLRIDQRSGAALRLRCRP